MIAARHHKALALFVGMLILFAATRAAAQDAPTTPRVVEVGADEPLHFTTGPRCTVGDVAVDLAPGRYLPEPTWSRLDTEVRRLQDAETRLTAENTSFRKQATESGPGWGTVVLILTAIAGGMTAGAVAF